MPINLSTIQFPQIALQTRDAHKLRGYFGNLFKEHSPLLHNHYETGELRYKYPLVQYKVLNGVPTLVAINKGAELLTQLFLKIKELQIGGETYPIYSKNIENSKVEGGYSKQLHEYSFATYWMGLNQDNHKLYTKSTHEEQDALLNRILVGNVLSFFKNIGVFLAEDEHLMTKVRLKEKKTKFKDKEMLVFEGGFVINALLPSGIGLGKGVSRGFGTIFSNP